MYITVYLHSNITALPWYPLSICQMVKCQNMMINLFYLVLHTCEIHAWNLLNCYDVEMMGESFIHVVSNNLNRGQLFKPKPIILNPGQLMFTVPFCCVDPLSCHIPDPDVIFSCGFNVVPSGCSGLSNRSDQVGSHLDNQGWLHMTGIALMAANTCMPIKLILLY